MMLQGGFGGFAAPGVAAIAPAPQKPPDGGPPLAAMAVFDTLIGCVNQADKPSYALGALRERLAVGPISLKKPLLQRLRTADPSYVPGRNQARGEALKQWLNSRTPGGNHNAAAVKWDDDAPDSAGETIELGIFRYELVEQLSKDLDLDEMRCLELVKAIVSRPQLRRVLEEALELGSGSLDATDSTYAAATELFYLEQGSISSVILKLLQLVHKDMEIDEVRRRELQGLVKELLLDKDGTGPPSLAEAIPDALVNLTREIRKLRELNNGDHAAQNSNPVVSRRRRFLRTQRLQLTEALFYLYQTFPLEPGSGEPAILDGGWVAKLVGATKELALDAAFFLQAPAVPSSGMMSAESSTLSDDELDDRPGILRVIAMLQLTTVCALRNKRRMEPQALSQLEQRLGIIRRGGGTLSFLDWENRGESDDSSGATATSRTPEESEAAAVRIRNYQYYASLGPQRQRRCKPEVHSAQGFAWLTLLVTEWAQPDCMSPAKEEECGLLFRRCLEHFSATWFTKVLLSFARVDACNSSDFRSRPEQMVLQPYMLDALATVIVRLRALIDLGASDEHLTPELVTSLKPRVLALPRPLSEYRAHQAQSEDMGVNLQEQDGLEEVVGMYAEFAIVYREEPDRLPLLQKHAPGGGVDPKFDSALLLRGLLKETEELSSQRFAPQGDIHSAHYLLYTTHSRLMEAAVLTSTHTDDPGNLPIPDELIDGSAPSDQPYWQFFCDGPVYINRTPLTLGEIGVTLERLKQGAPFPPESRQLMTESFMRAAIASMAFVLAALTNGLASPTATMNLKDRVTRALFPDGSARDGCPPLIKRLFWLCSSSTEWWSPTDDASTLVPPLRGVCFKVFAAWAAGNSSRLDTIWNLLTNSDTALLPDLARQANNAMHSSSAMMAGVHVNLMKRLENGHTHAATDGLLCLLKQILPPVSRASVRGGGARADATLFNSGAMIGSGGGGRRFGDATSEDLSFRKQGLWLRWALSVLEDAVCTNGSFSLGDDGERFKLVARALQVLLDVLESEHGSVLWRHEESERSLPNTIMFEMLSRTVLLKQVVSIISNTNDSPLKSPMAATLNAASALDEYCAMQSRHSIRKLFVRVPKAPDAGAAVQSGAGPTNYPSKPVNSAEHVIENWGWWRQRCVLLGLALLVAVAKKEDDFIDSWMTTPKQPRASMDARHSQQALTPHRLGDRLLHADDPRPALQALAYLMGYKRHLAIPVLASSLMSHLTRTHSLHSGDKAMSGERLLDALFVTDAQAEALVGHVGKALLGDGLFPPNPRIAWKPAADVDFVHAESEERDLFSLARSLTDTVFLGEAFLETSNGSVRDVQLAILEMLLGPLRDGLPTLPMAFLGLDHRLRFNECLRVILLLIALFDDCTFEDRACAAPLVEKCYELVFRLCAAGEALGRLEDVLSALQEGLVDLGRDPHFFYVPRFPVHDDTVEEAGVSMSYRKVCLDSIAAWHLKTSALALASACEPTSKRCPPREVVTKLLLEQPPLLLNALGFFFWSGDADNDQIEAAGGLPTSLLHSAVGDARTGELINLDRFRKTLEVSAQVDDGAFASAVEWATALNVRTMQRQATAGMVQGWESLLEVCVRRAPAVASDLLSGDRGLVALKELLMACALMLEQHPDADMQTMEPLARSCVILVHQLRYFHPLVSFSSGDGSLSIDVDWAGECLRLLLAAHTRRTLRSSHEYRASVVTTFNQLLRHLTKPCSTQDILLEAANLVLPDVSVAVRAAKKYVQACELHRESALGLLRETYDEVVSVLAKDACSEVAASTRCRIASLGALTLILQTLYEVEDDVASGQYDVGSGDGAYLSAKVLQSLWSDRHLERFVGMATSGTSDDCAMSLLLQVSLTELGATALRELGLVSHLIKHFSSLATTTPGQATPASLLARQAETLTSSCRVVSAMLGSLPSNAKLNDDVLRFIGVVSHSISDNLDTNQAFQNTASLRAAVASTRLLASFVGSLDPSRRDRVLGVALAQNGQLEGLYHRVCALLAQLAEFPHSGVSSDSSSLSAWSRPQPMDSREHGASRVKSLPPPPGLSLAVTAAWCAYDNMKAELWWELFSATVLFLRRIASFCSSSPAMPAQTLSSALATCLAVAEPLFHVQHSTSPLDSYNGLRDASLLVLENLMALATASLQHSEDDGARLNLKAGIGHLLPRVAALHGFPAAAAVFGAVGDSDWFLKKVTRLLLDEFEGE